MPAYLVGGCVRDLLLGVENLDLDFVIEGDALRVASDFARAVHGRITPHKRFGTATVVQACGSKVDFAMARKEIYPHPASLPLVTQGNLEEDLFRRDFTVNAMAMGVAGREYANLIDFFHGWDDLNLRKIRILHGLSFVDDPTRILRAIRFEQRYRFRIEPETLMRLREAVHLRMLKQVQPHRLRDELILLLKEEEPLKPIKRLQRLYGFHFIHPRLAVSTKTFAFFESLQRQLWWFEKAKPAHAEIEPWIMYLGVLLDSLSVSQTRETGARFAFRKDQIRRITIFKKISRQCVSMLKKKNIKPSQVYRVLESLPCETILLLRAKYPDRRLQKNTADFLQLYSKIRSGFTGDDLRKLGLPTGPAYQRILAGLLDARLDGLVKTRDEELKFIQRFIKKQ
jgi:tRNA nucleotidyltransferase (CCA-adding enzyme)